MISENHRFAALFFASTVVHLILIFSVAWTIDDPAPQAQSLEITLAQFKSEKAPDEADFLAQANQEGSGTLEEKAELSTTEMADFQANEIQEVVQQQKSKPQEAKAVVQKEVLATTQIADRSVVKTEFEEEQKENQSPPTNEEAQRIKNEIASLEAELRMDRQAYARRPRRKQLTAVSTRASADAAYLHAWRQKIESVGNMNYPDVDLFGSLTLLVAVRVDGTVERIEVRRSSGYSVLDDAAKRIVRMAAPFEPFPEEIRKQADVLEIIRTWQFDKDRYLSSF